MSTRKPVTTCSAIGTFLVGAMLAQAPGARPRPSPGRSAPAVQRIEYGDDGVEGERQSPDGSLIRARPRAERRPSLIEIPRSFLPAIAKTMEEL